MTEQTTFRLERRFEVSDVEKAVNRAVAFAKSRQRHRPEIDSDSREKLINVVSRIFEKVKRTYQEAFFTFGIGQNPEFWQIELYTNEPSLMAILEMVEDIILEAEDQSDGLYLAVVPLRVGDWTE